TGRKQTLGDQDQLAPLLPSLRWHKRALHTVSGSLSARLVPSVSLSSAAHTHSLYPFYISTHDTLGCALQVRPQPRKSSRALCQSSAALPNTHSVACWIRIH